MNLFNNMLRDDESLFLNPEHLDYDFQPKKIQFREPQHEYIALCIKPLFQNRNGKNLLITGSPGIGKTLSSKHIINELLETTDDIVPIYINCWKKDTTYKLALDICEQINYKWVQNKKTDQLFKEISSIINKKSLAIFIDEIDKAQDLQFLYYLLEDIYKKTIILITNNKSWLSSLDQRLSSRLLLDNLEFLPYTKKETHDILLTRRNTTFLPNIWNEQAFSLIVDKAYEIKDIRTGLFLLKESGNNAENRASKFIELKDTNMALKNLQTFKINTSEDLSDKNILEFIKLNSGKTIQELYDLYNPDISLKTFRRKIKDLEKSRSINIMKKESDQGGLISTIHYGSLKLTDY